MSTIPDPGRASKAVDLVTTAAPFDAIRNVTLEGREFWSARELMPLLGYTVWENFAEAVGRAKIAAHNSGHDVAQNFPGATKVTGSRGPAAQDYHLSRYACYLVALNGDPRKPEIAAAQTYFVIKAREAEVTNRESRFVIPQTYADALRELASEVEARELAESRARELAVPASAWNELAESAGDYSVADAAKVLSRDPNISTGERRLFKQMQGLGWVFRRDGHWSAYQNQVTIGRLVEKVNQPFMRNGESVAPAPTIRITPKGLQELHHRLGGGGAQMTLAVAE